MPLTVLGCSIKYTILSLRVITTAQKPVSINGSMLLFLGKGTQNLLFRKVHTLPDVLFKCANPQVIVILGIPPYPILQRRCHLNPTLFILVFTFWWGITAIRALYACILSLLLRSHPQKIRICCGLAPQNAPSRIIEVRKVWSAQICSVPCVVLQTNPSYNGIPRAR